MTLPAPDACPPPPPPDLPDAGLQDLLEDGDALILVPPFTALNLPALSAHLLQAWAAREGLVVRILYTHLLFARRVGRETYDAFSRRSTFDLSLPGERVFARAAHGLPPLGRNAARRLHREAFLGTDMARNTGGLELVYPVVRQATDEELLAMDARVDAFVDEVADRVANRRYLAVGCTCSFDQINATVALLRAVKRRQPELVTVVGGANCADSLAGGIASLDPDGQVIDHVFSGESEVAFTAFLQGIRAGRRPPDRIVSSLPLSRLDESPLPDFGEWDRQMARILPDQPEGPGQRELAWETSRGCYRGEKGHCRFCGLNGDDRRFRRKSPAGVAAGLAELSRRHPGRTVCLADNVFPESLLEPLGQSDHGANVQACLFPRVSGAQALRIRRAGLTAVTLGIEALDSDLLARMDKGTTAADNVLALRNLQSAGVHPYWNLLWGFPGDHADSYRRTLALLPLLSHIVPPRAVYHLSIDRASPYHQDPQAHGIEAVVPLPAYADLFPEGVDPARMAHHFFGTYACGSHDHVDLVRELVDRVTGWRARWLEGEPARLVVLSFGGMAFVVDSRGLPGTDATTRLDPALLGPINTPGPLDGSEGQQMALARRWAVALDGRYIPLLVCPADLLAGIAPPESDPRDRH